jgi:uncharacterized repeat protein (TIGR04138 family)
MERKSIEDIARADGRFSPEAITFVYEALGHTVRRKQATVGEDQPRHVKGQELCEGLGELAREKWGMLAKVVLNNWGIRCTRDFGEIVYLMIDNKWMSAQPEDRIEDFDNVFDFERFFEQDYRFDLDMKPKTDS